MWSIEISAEILPCFGCTYDLKHIPVIPIPEHEVSTPGMATPVTTHPHGIANGNINRANLAHGEGLLCFETEIEIGNGNVVVDDFNERLAHIPFHDYCKHGNRSIWSKDDNSRHNALGIHRAYNSQKKKKQHRHSNQNRKNNPDRLLCFGFCCSAVGVKTHTITSLPIV